MTANALLKFSQATPAAIEGDGEALRVVAGNDVLIEMSSVVDLATWAIELLDVPPGSTHGPIVPGTPSALDSGTNLTPPAFALQPDVPGSYRIRNVVTGTGGETSEDIRVFAVPETNGQIVPPYQRDPLPLDKDLQPNETNFDGQLRGYAGDSTDAVHPLGDAVLRNVDRLNFDAVQTIYFGKHGNNLSDGLQPSKAKLTYGAAVTAAAALSPATGKRIAIVCLDAGSYGGGPAIPSWCLLDAPFATFTSGLVLLSDSFARVGPIELPGGGVCVTFGGTDAVLDAARLIATGPGATGVAGSSGINYTRVGQLRVGPNSAGIGSGSGSKIAVDIGAIVLQGNANCAGISSQVSGSSISGRVGRILEEGSGVGNGTGIHSSASAGTAIVDLIVGSIVAADAIKVEAGTVSALVASLSGALTHTGGVLNVLTANYNKPYAIPAMTDPGTPAAGFCYLWKDSTDGKVKVRDESGTTTDLTGAFA